MRRRLRERGLESRISTQLGPLVSSGQRRLWHVWASDPDDTSLHVCVGYRLVGELDGERLRAAVNTVAGRHEVLRTRFGVDDAGELVTWVVDDGLRWTQRDVRNEAELLAVAASECGRRYDLSSDAPLRATIVRTAADECVLLLVVHHICWDDESWAVFFAEVSAAYAGRELPRVCVPVREIPVDHSGYWRQLLAESPTSRWPLGRERRGEPARRWVRAIPNDVATRIADVAREHGSTRFMVLLAAFAVVLQRFAGGSDFLVATPTTTRTGTREGVIGYFGDVALLRCAVDRGIDFGGLVDATRDRCADIFAHPIAIDDAVRLARPGERARLADIAPVSFGLRTAPDDMLTLPGVDISRTALRNAAAPFPVSVMVECAADGAMVVEVECRAGVLDERSATALADGMVRAVALGCAEPSHPVRQLELLDEATRWAELARSRGPALATGVGTVCALLARGIAAHPDRIAVSAEDGDRSYVDLDRESMRLARWLIRQGVGPERLVALRMTASWHFVVAVVAVIRAGGAYLPIDPAYPADRIARVLTDTRPVLELDVDAVATALRTEPDRETTFAPPAPARAENLAYVIHTSGSTGAPRGVAVSHGALAEYLTGLHAEYDLTADDTLLQTVSVGFDASVLEIFATLTVGARLVIPKPSRVRDPERLLTFARRHGVTVLHAVPSLLAELTRTPNASDGWVRHIPVGGEPLTATLAADAAKVFGAVVSNHYGPTEAVVSVTHHRVEHHDDGPVPIGMANGNTSVFLLDEGLALSPPGAVGEMYVGGNQLARGYFGKPGLTAQRFIADPFTPGGRLYRTGDLARRDPVGALEFLGRVDGQVKVRGMRIELGEVEAAVAAHPDVERCVAAVRGNAVAAYIVSRTGATPDTTRVLSTAARALPAAMVPTTVAVIDRVPVTAHGKVDRQALPVPERPSFGGVAVTTGTQARVAARFQEILGVSRVGADDSFFALGGHSLLAGRLVAALRREFGVDMDIRAPFDNPTVAELAAVVDAAAAARHADSWRRRSPEVAQPVPLSYSQAAMWFANSVGGVSLTIAVAARITGPLSAPTLAAAVTDVIARHEALRTICREHDGVPHQVVLPPSPVDIPVDRVSQAALPEELAKDAGQRFAAAENRTQVAASAELPIRVRILRVDTGDECVDPLCFCPPLETHVLSLAVNHMVADQWSLRTVFADIGVAYRARRGLREPDWPDVPVGHTSFARWQRDTFGPSPTELGSAKLAYWAAALAGLPEEIPARHDRPRPPILGTRGESAAVPVPAELRTALGALAIEAGTSEHMVCQAAVAVLMHTLGGGVDIAVGTPVAGDTDETAGLVGLFANIVVLRTDLTGDPTLRQVLERSRATSLGAYRHADVPLERVVEVVAPTRSMARNPLFQTVVHYRDRHVEAPNLGAGAEVVMVDSEFSTAYLDLSLTFLSEPSGALSCGAITNLDLYDPGAAQWITDRLLRVMRAFAYTPDLTLGALDVDMPRPPASVAAPPSTRLSPPSDADTLRVLAELLAELLSLDSVEPDEEFFALGGDSVLSVQWASRANARGIPLTPHLVFQHATVADVAAAVAAAAPAVDHHHAPLTTSGLSTTELAELTARWNER